MKLNRKNLFLASSAVITVTLSTPSLLAQSGNWTFDGDGNWTVPTNWSGNITANGTDSTATLENIITANRTITLDANQTIGNITAADTAQNYTIAGPGELTLDVTTGAPIISVVSGRTLTISSTIAGNDGLTKTDQGTLLLSGNNTFTGAVTVNRGTLSVTNDNALGGTAEATTIAAVTANISLSLSAATGNLSIAENLNFNSTAANGTSARAQMFLANNSPLIHTLSGAIDVTSDTNIPSWDSGGNTSLATLRITGDITGNFTGGAGGLLIRGLANGNATLTPINKIEGNVTLNGGGITKTDNGTWQMGALGKTYKAPVLTVANGLLLMKVDNYLDTATPVLLQMGTSSGGSTGVLNLNGTSQTVGGINIVAGGTSGTKTITNSSGTPVVLTVDNAGNYTTGTSGSLAILTGNMSLVKTGVGIQILGGNNTYNGNTTINGGTLQIGNGTDSGSIASSSNIVNNASLVYNVGNGTRTYANTITGNGSLTQSSAGGTLTLSGNNSYSGGTTVTAGTLSTTAAAALPGYNSSGKVVFNGNATSGTVSVQIGGAGWTEAQMLDLIGNATKTAGLLGIDTTNGNFTQGATAYNLGSGLGLTKFGANSTLTLTQANTYSGNTNIGAGTLRLENLAATGSSPLIAVNGNRLEIGTASAYAGPNISMGVAQGTIVSDRAGSGAGFTHVFGNLSVAHQNLNFLAGSNVTSGTAAIQVTGMTCASGSGGSTTLNPTTADLIIAGNATGTNTGTSTFVLGGTSTGNRIDGVIENGTRSAQNITKSNTSTWTLSGNNTYTGNTTVGNGTLIFTKAVALPAYATANATRAVTFNGGTLGVQVGGSGWSDTEVNDLLANATKTSGALGIDTTNGNYTQGVAYTTTNLGSALGLNKLGANTLTLDQANTYAGTTTVTAGTLLVNGSTANGTVTVAANATLGGNGTLGGATTVNGNLAPGNGIGQITFTGGLTTGNLTDSSLKFQLGANTTAGTTYDTVVTNALDIGTTLDFPDFEFTGTPAAGTYTLISSGNTTGTLGGNLTGPIGAFTGTLSKPGNDIILTVTGGITTPYDDWATAKGLTGANNGKADDPDKDGRNNLAEFALDGNPLSGANDGKVVGRVGTVGGSQVMTLTLPVRGTAPTPIFSDSSGDELSALIDGIYYRIEGDVSLSTFDGNITEVTGPDAAAIQLGLPGLSDINGDTIPDWSYRTFRATPGTVPTVPKAFLRAKISETP